MQHLEVSCAVRRFFKWLGFKGLRRKEKMCGRTGKRTKRDRAVSFRHFMQFLLRTHQHHNQCTSKENGSCALKITECTVFWKRQRQFSRYNKMDKRVSVNHKKFYLFLSLHAAYFGTT